MRIEEFQDFLEKDLAWRKMEISQLLMILNSAETKDIIGKSIILLLYAHWEGFIKK
ncbi:MAG: MAE_28990/MAE_18760 family HEPN-like nuclease, partial [Candidatus Merdivicinus sp.]